jgi:hypothetical protein
MMASSCEWALQHGGLGGGGTANSGQDNLPVGQASIARLRFLGPGAFDFVLVVNGRELARERFVVALAGQKKG